MKLHHDLVDPYERLDTMWGQPPREELDEELLPPRMLDRVPGRLAPPPPRGPVEHPHSSLTGARSDGLSDRPAGVDRSVAPHIASRGRDPMTPVPPRNPQVQS